MARIATERVARSLTWLGGVLLVSGALVVIGGIAFTRSIDALVTAASIAALAFGVPGAAAFGLAFWLEYAAERVERKAISALNPDARHDSRVADSVRKYALAVVAVLCAWGIRAGLDVYIPDEVPFITFFLAVAVAGWTGGFGPALAATAMAAAVAGTLYVRPDSGADIGRFMLLGIFLLVCLGIAAIVSALHEALERAHQLAIDAKRVAEASRGADGRLRMLAQAAPAALFTTDTEQQCTYCNRTWLAFRGRRLAEELGNGWWNGVHRDDLSRRRDGFAAALATREPRAIAYRLQHADGGYREVRDVVVAYTGARGEVLGLLGASSEVTIGEEEEESSPAAEIRQ